MVSASIIPILVFTSLILNGCLAIDNGTDVTADGKQREGKVFSLFSIVQFKNQGCRSQSTMTSGQSPQRNGTCYTSSECSTKGGTASGNCASGFGVCCIFLVSAGGATINQNCTYLRNPGFPSVLTTSSTLTYTVNKCSTDVCFLRLDFETFAIVGPTDTVEQANSCPDLLKITTSTSQTVPPICGSNAGQHIYVDIGNGASDSVGLGFTFSSTPNIVGSTSRQWEIKISQIQCSNPNRPPGGCLQYFTTPTGRITTFNFIPTSSAKLSGQQYTVCIRKSAGFCCTRYELCANTPNAFSIGTVVPDNLGSIDATCTTDFISIPGSSQLCTTTSGSLHTKYCGVYLGILGADGSIAGVLNAVCDCTPPFTVGVTTDSIQQSATVVNRGVCLDYQQVPCSTV